jgi:LPS sulfotransferase NodH
MVSAESRDALTMTTGAAAGKSKGSGALRSGDHLHLKLPSFIVVGPPRTGTSWLHEVLSEHTDLPDPTKETRFFDLHFDRGLGWYLDHFSSAREGCLRGEVAPTYFRSAAARDRIAQTIPGVKLVFIFRHPVQRLVSLYRLKRAYGRLSWNLDEALERDPELVESSLYATNLREWQSKFPREQLSINLYEDLSSNPQAFVDRLADFLGLSRFQLQESQLKQVYSTAKMTEPRNFFATRVATVVADWCKARRLDHVVAGVKNSHLIKLFLGGGEPFPDIPLETLKKIRTQMLCEIEELEEILGRDLSHWKSPPSLP